MGCVNLDCGVDLRQILKGLALVKKLKITSGSVILKRCCCTLELTCLPPYPTYILLKEEIFATFGLPVGNSLESSCINKMWWPLMCNYSLYIVAEIASGKLPQSFNLH